MMLGIDLKHLVLDQLMLQRLNQRQHEQLNLLPTLASSSYAYFATSATARSTYSTAVRYAAVGSGTR